MAPTVKDPISHLLDGLRDHLRTVYDGVVASANVVLGWPDPTIQIALPSVSIVQQRGTLYHCRPYIVESEDDGDDKICLFKLGSVHLPIQVDLWGGSKSERGQLWELLMGTFVSLESTTTQTLTLSDYWDQEVALDLIDPMLPIEQEEPIFTGEHRGKVGILGRIEWVVQETYPRMTLLDIDMTASMEQIQDDGIGGGDVIVVFSPSP